MTTHSSPAADRADDLRALMLSSQRFRQATADRFELSLNEVVALGHLSDAADGLTPRELGERMLLRSGTLSAIIDRLATSGYARRDPNPADRRSSLVKLTPSGRQVVRSVQRRLQRVIARADEVAAADGHRVLAALATALDDETVRVRRGR